ncbi:MAG: cell division protein ZapE [Deferribacterales bacterium]
MNTAEKYIDLNVLSFDISVEQCFENLRPHPKFSGCTFDNYIPDERYQSQAQIKQLLQDTLMKMKMFHTAPAKQSKSLFSFMKKSAPKQDSGKPRNIYIDGSYGIGKTHLLSSCYNICQKGNKAFMSFGEMNYFFHYLGVEKCIEHFSALSLLLIDEFELDDPAMTHIMAKFFREINENTLIITTSNTLPTELGKLRFQTDNFTKQLGEIASTFETVIVEGEDYRKRNKQWMKTVSEDSFLDTFAMYTPETKPKSKISFDNLIKILESTHPFRYFVIPEAIEAIFIDGLQPFPTLNNALRFNQLVDHCYYYNTKLFIRSSCQLSDIFPPELIESSFQKKLLRCLSRLDELAIFYRERD